MSLSSFLDNDLVGRFGFRILTSCSSMWGHGGGEEPPSPSLPSPCSFSYCEGPLVNTEPPHPRPIHTLLPQRAGHWPPSEQCTLVEQSIFQMMDGKETHIVLRPRVVWTGNSRAVGPGTWLEGGLWVDTFTQAMDSFPLGKGRTGGRPEQSPLQCEVQR